MLKRIIKLSRTGTYTVGTVTKIRLRFFLSVLLGSSLFMTGCTTIGNDDYSCSGLPEGVQCMSARDVYTATNDGNVPRTVKAGEEFAYEESEKNVSRISVSEYGQKDTVIDNYVAPRIPNRPMPIRTPAEVMRIWIAPWEDTNGDLIVTGYVYTEIEPRRWVIGESTQTSVPTLTPLQTIKPQIKTQ